MSDSLGNFIEQHTQEVAETNYELGRASLEAENALLKKKLEIALWGLDEYGDSVNWGCSSCCDGEINCHPPHDSDVWRGFGDTGYELARRIKAEIEEVK